jgi:hypothetical protein
MDRGQTFLRELGVDFLLSQIPKKMREPLPWVCTPTLFSPAGGGLHGHLALTMTDAEYLAIAGTPFIVPLNPGTLTHLPGATGPQIAEAVRTHKEQMDNFQLYYNVDKALRNQLLAATPEAFIQTIKDPYLGFGQRSCLDVIIHLRTTYGEITPNELDKNAERMAAAWHPSTPIEDLFEQLRAGQAFATEGGDAPSAPQIVRLGYNLIFKTGLFNTACREWRDKPAADKTFANLKTHFKLMGKRSKAAGNFKLRRLPRRSPCTVHPRQCQQRNRPASTPNPSAHHRFLHQQQHRRQLHPAHRLCHSRFCSQLQHNHYSHTDYCTTSPLWHQLLLLDPWQQPQPQPHKPNLS